MADVDGDGDQDIVSGEYFHPEAKSAVWLEQVATSEQVTDNWQTYIDETSGPSIQFEVFTENNTMYGLLSNHTNTEMANPDTIPSGLYRCFNRRPNSTLARRLCLKSLSLIPHLIKPLQEYSKLETLMATLI